MHIMACIFLLELINCESVQVKFMDYTSKEVEINLIFSKLIVQALKIEYLICKSIKWTSLYEHNVKQAVASQLADYCSQSDCAVTKKEYYYFYN